MKGFIQKRQVIVNIGSSICIYSDIRFFTFLTCADAVESGMSHPIPAGTDDDTPAFSERGDEKTCRRNWAILIQKIYEVDPLVCPNCRGNLRTISFIKSLSVKWRVSRFPSVMINSDNQFFSGSDV